MQRTSNDQLKPSGDNMLSPTAILHKPEALVPARLRALVTLAVIITMCVSAGHAQEVVVDWASKKVTSQPSTVEKNTKATVRIDNVNDMMFTYSISHMLLGV